MTSGLGSHIPALFGPIADLQRHSNQVRQVLGLHFQHEAGAVDFDRSGANVELLGDFPVRKTDDDILEHLPFTWRQLFDLLCGLS